MAPLRVGVSVVSLNRPDTLRRTLEVLERTLPDVDPGVIVDNGSNDPKTLALLTQYESLGWDVIRNPENRGLSTAVNQGLSMLAAYECDILVHLDDDAVIDAPEDWVGALTYTFETNPELGLFVPNGRAQYIEFIQRPNYDEIRWALGYIWALRSTAYEQVGGYDPLLLHQQECDFGLRIRMAGFTVGTSPGWKATHNDPGHPPSPLSEARAHLGVVQFVDKWCSYFRGRDWNYGTVPVYRMQQWPPDQEWYRRFSKVNNIELNPAPPEYRVENVAPGERVIEIIEVSEQGKIEGNALARRIMIGSQWYFCFVELRNEYAHWARGTGYLDDRDRAIAKWKELTGETYETYPWPSLIKCI